MQQAAVTHRSSGMESAASMQASAYDASLTLCCLCAAFELLTPCKQLHQMSMSKRTCHADQIPDALSMNDQLRTHIKFPLHCLLCAACAQHLLDQMQLPKCSSHGVVGHVCSRYAPALSQLALRGTSAQG